MILETGARRPTPWLSMPGRDIGRFAPSAIGRAPRARCISVGASRPALSNVRTGCGELGRWRLSAGTAFASTYATPARSTTPNRSSCCTASHSSRAASTWSRGLLRASGRRTLIPSQRGYLASARPRARRAYAATETAADVVALLDAAGLGRVHLVGHDWGGAQAWTVAGSLSGSGGVADRALHPTSGGLARSWVSSSQALKSWYMAFFQLPVLPEVLSGRTLAKTFADSGLPADHVTEYAEAMTASGARPAHWLVSRDAVRFARPLGRSPCRPATSGVAKTSHSVAGPPS